MHLFQVKGISPTMSDPEQQFIRNLRAVTKGSRRNSRRVSERSVRSKAVQGKRIQGRLRYVSLCGNGEKAPIVYLG